MNAKPSINTVSSEETKLVLNYYKTLYVEYIGSQDESILLQFNELGSLLCHSGIPPEIATEIHAAALNELSVNVEVSRFNEYQKILPLLEVTMAYGVQYRNQMAQQKRRSSHQLVQTMEQASDLMFLTDVQGKVIYANSLSKKYFDASAGNLFEQYSAKDNKEAQKISSLWQELSIGKSWQGKICLISSDRESLVISLKAFPMIEDDFQLSQFVFVVEDVTQKQIAKRKLEQNQRLTTLGELASGVAHEFNNILLIISGFAELLGNEKNRAFTKEFSEEILMAVEKGVALNKQILSFAADRIEVEKPVCLSYAIKNLTTMLKAAVGENIAITIVGELGVKVLVSENHLCQLLTNLCINAKHAIEEVKRSGVVELVFSVLGEDLRVTVRDNGCGMSEEILRNVFEPFYTTKDVGKGSGLGLSVVMRLVMQYKGEIEVLSEVGKGTEFHISLPVVYSEISNVKLVDKVLH